MRTRIGGIAVVCIAVATGAGAWVDRAQGFVPAALVVLGAAAAVLAVALGLERRRSRRFEAALERETERVRELSDHSWRSELLAQIVDELEVFRDEDTVLPTALSTLGGSLQASRVVLYERVRHLEGAFRLKAQFVADGVPPLGADAALPAILASDRALAERLSRAALAGESLPELRAVAERLQVGSSVVVPVGEHHMMTVDRLDEAPAWTSVERSQIQRFGEKIGSALATVERDRAHVHRVESRAALLRVALALSRARDFPAVVEIATAVGAPVIGARGSAILVDGASRGFRVAGQNGFEPELSSSSVASLEPELDDAVRSRAPIHVDGRALTRRGSETKARGALLAVPLYYGRESLGVFLFEKGTEKRSWQGDATENAQTLAHLTASALENANRFEVLGSHEARYAELYDAAPDLYQTIDSKGRILDSNLAHQRMLGYDKEELAGLRFESLLAQESVTPWRRLASELFGVGGRREPEGGVGLRLRARDGRSVDVRLTASVVPATDSRPLSARLVMRDVSELRRLEQQLRQSQKLEVVGALAGGIAHDFNNVLGGILGYASLLRAHLQDRPGIRRYADTIERSAVRGAQLSGRLLAASRKTPARKEPVNINRVVEETLDLLAHTFDKRVRISKRLDPRVRPVLADGGQLQQIVLNLCVNARDAMREGGLLRISTEVHDADERLSLSVEDTGIGMEPSTIERLFEPFYSTKGKGGSGLGLSVVYGIVKSMGGDIRVQSSPGQGARFDVFIPTAWTDERGELADPSEPAVGRGELVLLVDDERVLRDLAKEILESHGYRVEAVGSGEDAVCFIRDSREPVSLVILDLVMPGLDGGETYRRLRDVDAEVPVLLSSGLSAEDVVDEILAAGAAGFIPKPYGMGELTRAVRSAIGGDAELMH